MTARGGGEREIGHFIISLCYIAHISALGLASLVLGVSLGLVQPRFSFLTEQSSFYLFKIFSRTPLQIRI